MSRHLPAGVFLRRKPTLEESLLLSTLVKFNLCSMLPSVWNRTNCKKKLKGTLKVFYFLTCTSLIMYFVYPVSLWSKMWRSNRTSSRPMVEACRTKIP